VKNIRRNLWINILVIMFISTFLTSMLHAQSEGEMKSSTNKDNDATAIVDGMDFQGKIGTYGDPKGDAEQIAFENGTFHSFACDAYGFRPAKYTAEKNTEGNIIFSAETTNQNGDKMLWHGMIKADKSGQAKEHKVEAYATMVPEGKKGSVLYWVKGSSSEQSMKQSSGEVKKDIKAYSKEGN
jgi:hypothetical protein